MRGIFEAHQCIWNGGEACWVEQKQYNSHGCAAKRQALLAEVVAIDQAGAHLLPFDRLDGIGVGARVMLAPDQSRVRPSEGWLGRVLDAFGRPLDGGPPLAAGPESYWLQAPPIEAHRRRDLGPRLDLGVRALNLFTPCREGQRMGIFAGSGVGKSTLLAMLARHSNADALVLGLIGERGRELSGFLHQGLGPQGLARSVVVVATSDLPAMVRRRAAYVALTVAEANGCDYCLSAHTLLGKGAGLGEADIRSARDAASSDPKTAALLRFARKLVVERGRTGDADLDALRRAGATDGEILEVVAHVGLNVFTNYVNLVADTDIDFPVVRAAERRG